MTGIERFALNISREICKIEPAAMVVSSRQISGVPNAHISRLLSFTQFLTQNYEYLLRAFWDQTVFRCIAARQRPDVLFFPIQDGLLYPSIRQIVTVHDLHYLHFDHSIPDCRQEIPSFRTKLYHYKMPHILERSTAVVAVSESTKQDIVTSFGISPDKIHVIYNGYDNLLFRVIENPQPTLDRYGLRSGKYFLFVGSILKHKNISRLVQAFARLESEAVLVIAGACKDAEHLDDLRRETSVTGLSETRLRYLDYVTDEDLPYLYNGALAFILPSLHEGFGVPIIEAMACGTPVITSNCSAMPEVAGDAALLVDPYSVESIAAAMRDVLDNTHLADSMRTAGLERAKLFNWSNSAQKLYDLCKLVSEM
ncbi:MAG: glycosyltransferase family 4 protein [Desulfuromonadaceae bacterium]